jgi:hypothetical protein
VKSTDKHLFTKQFASWSSQVSTYDYPDWTEQLRILNDIADLITPQLSLEDIIEAIYENVNHLLDAYQFAVGIYNENEGTLLYKGMIEKKEKGSRRLGLMWRITAGWLPGASGMKRIFS